MGIEIGIYGYAWVSIKVSIGITRYPSIDDFNPSPFHQSASHCKVDSFIDHDNATASGSSREMLMPTSSVLPEVPSPADHHHDHDHDKGAVRSVLQTHSCSCCLRDCCAPPRGIWSSDVREHCVCPRVRTPTFFGQGHSIAYFHPLCPRSLQVIAGGWLRVIFHALVFQVFIMLISQSCPHLFIRFEQRPKDCQVDSSQQFRGNKLGPSAFWNPAVANPSE